MFTWKTRSEYGPVPKVYNDVDGCAPDTVKKCIQTKRRLNPLDPDYIIPGHSEFAAAGNEAYGPEGSSMVKAKVQKVE